MVERVITLSFRYYPGTLEVVYDAMLNSIYFVIFTIQLVYLVIYLV